MLFRAGEILEGEAGNGPATLAGLLYQQLEAVEAKQADLLQASKCLIFLTPHLHSLDERQGRLPAQHAAANDITAGETSQGLCLLFLSCARLPSMSAGRGVN